MLISTTSLAILIPLTIFAVATPGPDMLYVLSHSGQLKRTGIIAALGIITGLLIHTLAVAVGLGELFMHSPQAFKILKWAGAAYLMYLAISILLSKEESKKDYQQEKIPYASIYFKGFFTNVLNPKAFMYFMAIIPQFVDSSLGHVQAQLFTIALIDIILAFLTFSFISLVAHYCGKWMDTSTPFFNFIKRYGLASLFGILAIKLSL